MELKLETRKELKSFLENCNESVDLFTMHITLEQWAWLLPLDFSKQCITLSKSEKNMGRKEIEKQEERSMEVCMEEEKPSNSLKEQKSKVILRDLLHQLKLSPLLTNDLKEIFQGELTPLSIKEAFLGLSNFSEAVLIHLCDTIQNSKNYFSSDIICSITEQLIVPKIASIESSISKGILTRVLHLSQTYEEVFPGSFSKAAMEFMSSSPESLVFTLQNLMEESFSSKDNQRLLSLLLCARPIQPNFHLPVLKTALELPDTTFSPTILEEVCSFYADTSPDMAKSVEFGKILLMTIKKFGQHLNESQRNNLQRAAASHRTAMQKLLESSLQRM